MSTAVTCSILVPAYNEEHHIAESVRAMCAQRLAGTIEIIIADGGSTDETRKIVSALAAADPRIRLCENPRSTVSSGLNVALSHARGVWVARMDAHTVYPPDYIALGIARLSSGGTRWVSGPQLPRGRSPISRAVAIALSGPLGQGQSRKWATHAAPEEPEYTLDTGVFAGVWSRATVLDYGGWDERWAKNEDSEMAARFLADGERLVCVPAMAAEYSPRGTLGGLCIQYRDYGRYRMRTARRHPRSLRRSLLLPPSLCLTAAVAAIGPRRPRALARAGLRAYLLALAFTGAAGAREADARPADAALVPLVLAVMHFSFGAGAIKGAVRDGPPVVALASLAGFAWRSNDADIEPVWAPSLTI